MKILLNKMTPKKPVGYIDIYRNGWVEFKYKSKEEQE